MNKYAYYACMACCLLTTATADAHDGRVYVTGTITDNTCTLSPDSENINVEMGSVSNRQFYQAGDGSAWQPFAIDLQNCGSTVSGVTVSFQRDGKSAKYGSPGAYRRGGRCHRDWHWPL